MATGPLNPARRRSRLALVAAGIALLAPALPAPAARAAESAPAPAHRCACGMNCKTACCCAKKVPAPASSPAPERPAPREQGGGACWMSAPCGGDAAPSVAPSWRPDRSILALAGIAPAPLPTAERLPADPARPRPLLDSAPPDEPPEAA